MVEVPGSPHAAARRNTNRSRNRDVLCIEVITAGSCIGLETGVGRLVQSPAGPGASQAYIEPIRTL